MNNTSLILPGDKLDIVLSDISGNTENIYKSSVSDIIADNIWEITMPVSSGRIVLFQVGMQFDFVLYTAGKTIYKCSAIVRRRYKKESLFFLAIELISNLEKVQRRQFFRLPCTIDMHYYMIERNDDDLHLFDEKKFCIDHYKKHYAGSTPESLFNAVILDISGGGIRFSGDILFEKNTYLMTEFILPVNGRNETFSVIGTIVDCEQNTGVSGKYFTRLKFIFDNIGKREKIVRYVFEEERRIRRKEMG